MDFEPLHSAHAIESVSFHVAFDQQLDDAGLQTAKKALGDLPELPGRSEIRTMSVPIGVAGAASAESGGYAYTNSRPDGVIQDELHVTRNAISTSTRNYIRWADAWRGPEKYFGLLVPIYLETAKVLQITLNYVDKFVPAEPSKFTNPARILRPGSVYLAPQIFQQEDLWHSYTGRFERVSATIKRLLSINVDCLTERTVDSEKTVLVIKTLTADYFNQPGYEAHEMPRNAAPQLIRERFEELHQYDKRVMIDMLSPQMADRIGLTAKK